MGDKLCPLLLAANPSNVGGKAACRAEECALWRNSGCGMIAVPEMVSDDSEDDA